MSKKKIGVQKELPLKVKLDAVGKAAKKYLSARGWLEDAKDALFDCGANLVKELRKAKRAEIKIDGLIITIRHIDQDLLKVIRPKEK